MRVKFDFGLANLRVGVELVVPFEFELEIDCIPPVGTLVEVPQFVPKETINEYIKASGDSEISDFYIGELIYFKKDDRGPYLHILLEDEESYSIKSN